MKPVAWHFPEDDPFSVSCTLAKVFRLKSSVLNSCLRSISSYLFWTTETVQPFPRGRLICNHFMEKLEASLLKEKVLKFGCKVAPCLWWIFFFVLYRGGKTKGGKPISVCSSGVKFCIETVHLGGIVAQGCWVWSGLSLSLSRLLHCQVPNTPTSAVLIPAQGEVRPHCAQLTGHKRGWLGRREKSKEGQKLHHL